MTEAKPDEHASHLLRVADMLSEAWDRAEAVPAPTTLNPETDLADAYRIQDLVIERRLERGRTRAGWKMGLTSAAGATPIVGTLLDDMIVPSGERLDPALMVAPMIEAEIAFFPAEPIEAGTTAAMIAAGAHGVAPALEVIDYRTRDSNGPVDWVADNSTVAYAVVGERLPLAALGSLAATRVQLTQDGGQIAAGAGAQVMGDPLQAIAWLADHLAERGRDLAAGAVVLTGSLTGHHSVRSGSTYAASFDSLGSVSVSFDA